jgi:hypothetical protein
MKASFMSMPEQPSPVAGQRPKLRAIVLLKCPYCLETPLRKSGSWFEFRTGCPRCLYRYEREEGYFWGAPWMINYPLTSALTLSIIIAIYQSPKDWHPLWIATVAALSAMAVAILFFPFARAIWLVGDHWLHPLRGKDYWSQAERVEGTG